MRKLTRREIILLSIVVLVVLILLIEPIIRQGFPGDELATKRDNLQTARNLIQLAQLTQRIDGEIQAQVGLEGRIISDSLFDEIANRVELEALNQARRASTLARLHPALENKADSLLAYKQQHGAFGSLDELQKIRGPIFEGEQPQAVISRRISDLAKQAGLRPNYQLNIRPTPGTKSENLPSQTKKNLVYYLYLGELAQELQRLESQQNAIKEKKEQKQVETKEAAMEAMFDAWWGKDDAENKDKDGSVKTVSEKPSGKDQTGEELGPKAKPVAAKDKLPTPKRRQSEPNSQFASLPEVIPLAMRIELLQLIQSNLNQQLAEAVEFRRGFLADQIMTETDETKGGFLGIGGKKQTTAIKFKPNSVLLSKFETLISRYEPGYEEGTETKLDYDQQIRALTEYIDQILEQEDQLHGWFAAVPSTHQPEAYIVDMRFSSNLERIVRLIYTIESSSKWLQVKDLQITIADKKETTISANLSMIARVL
jgi:hypothetical protein